MTPRSPSGNRFIRPSRPAILKWNQPTSASPAGTSPPPITAGVVAITRNDRLVRPDDLRRVMSTAQTVKVPSDRKLLHVIPRTYAVDGQPGVKNPVGMHGFRLDVETHIITAAANSIQNLVKCVRGVGIDIDDLVLEPLASSEAVLTEDEHQVGVAIADIGGGTTDICVFKDGSIYHTAILPVAGYQLTRDVAIGLGLPFEVAEEMKKRYGTVMPVYENNMAQGSPFPRTGTASPTRTCAIFSAPGSRKSCAWSCWSSPARTTNPSSRPAWC